ncbi:hypothetical protein JIR001_25490 [Polycladomyces abyssicola]|uniref:Uncharacterized protein n=1 Tax=Polycladomyces abyssicola TaxID=1125966 RepID=A0A8D5UFU9_9BACL|nr:hypothetical protein JIR001_25490 [Polycladomyces abyssicola]
MYGKRFFQKIVNNRETVLVIVRNFVKIGTISAVKQSVDRDRFPAEFIVPSRQRAGEERVPLTLSTLFMK